MTLALTAAIAAELPAAVGDVHLLPTAAGDGDGSSWAHARGVEGADLGALIAALPPGASLLLGSGEYRGIQLPVASSGEAGAPIGIRGVDTGGGVPRLIGDWTRNEPSKGRDLITLGARASHLVVENLEIRSYRRVVFTDAGGHADLRFADLDIGDVRTAFYLIGGRNAADPEAWTRDVLIERCRVIGYTKRAVRLQGGNHHVLVRDVAADMGGEPYATERFAMGFHVIGDKDAGKEGREPAHDHHIRFERCRSDNHYDDNGDGYWNADGFAAEGGCHDIVYVDCSATNNTDGGWDDKSTNPILIGCRATANKRNYRFWGRAEGRALLIDCEATAAHKYGGSGDATALWSKGAILMVGGRLAGNPKLYSTDGDLASLELRGVTVEHPAERQPWGDDTAVAVVGCTGLEDQGETRP